MNAGADVQLADLALENAKLRKIRDVLVRRVERSMDLQGSEFALFERATLLEAEVRKRTKQVEQAMADLQRSNRELEEARARADAANMSKTRFLAAASHDLLQPLNAARLFLSALAETALPESAERLVENVDLAFESIDRLLTALLDISKLDAGVVTPVIENVALDPLLRRLVAEFAPVAERKGLALRMVPTDVVVATDPGMLIRALMNLVSNAIRYTRRGGVLIGVRRHGAGFRVEVVDTGIGIPANQQSLIFEEFRRLGVDSDQRDRGFGLGLAIVERIARMLGHPLSVQSVPGRGSRFALFLPAGIRAPARATADAGVSTAPRSQGALLVVIENEAAIRDGMQALLQGWGYVVLAAPSPEVAIGLLRRGRRRPAAVIADYHLDGCTGTDAIEMVRIGFGTAIPALVITADRTPEVQREVEAVAAALLNKPVRPAQLRSLLAELLSKMG
ncbi:MAG: hybrid sensor histidine kinase/response regulator [Geminicoccaceae bacterium]